MPSRRDPDEDALSLFSSEQGSPTGSHRVADDDALSLFFSEQGPPLATNEIDLPEDAVSTGGRLPVTDPRRTQTAPPARPTAHRHMRPASLLRFAVRRRVGASVLVFGLSLMVVLWGARALKPPAYSVAQKALESNTGLARRGDSESAPATRGLPLPAVAIPFSAAIFAPTFPRSGFAALGNPTLGSAPVGRVQAAVTVNTVAGRALAAVTPSAAATKATSSEPASQPEQSARRTDGLESRPLAPPIWVAAPVAPPVAATIATVPLANGVPPDVGSSRPVAEADAVRQTLHHYEEAYEGLDVLATAKVWPSVDRRALARAFATLKSQGLTLQGCTISVAESTATAHCRGTIQYVRKVGGPTPFTARQDWFFRMRKFDAEWMIEKVTASQP